MAIVTCRTSPTLLGGWVRQLVLLYIKEVHVSFPGGVTNFVDLTDSRTQVKRRDIRATRYHPTNLLASRWSLGRYDPHQEEIVMPPCAATNIKTHPLAYILGLGHFQGIFW